MSRTFRARRSWTWIPVEEHDHPRSRHGTCPDFLRKPRAYRDGRLHGLDACPPRWFRNAFATRPLRAAERALRHDLILALDTEDWETPVVPMPYYA